MIDRVYELTYTETSHTVSILPNTNTNTHSSCELDIINTVIQSGQVIFSIFNFQKKHLE